jgi:hypothetical protein
MKRTAGHQKHHWPGKGGRRCPRLVRHGGHEPVHIDGCGMGEPGGSNADFLLGNIVISPPARTPKNAVAAWRKVRGHGFYVDGNIVFCDLRQVIMATAHDIVSILWEKGAMIMSEYFQEAPLPLGSVFRQNDHVVLVSKPVGEPCQRYRLNVRISSIHNGSYRGIISSVENQDDRDKPGNFFHKDEQIDFEKRHIQGCATKLEVNA